MTERSFTTVRDVVQALEDLGREALASELSLPASVQSVSNALRHAEQRGLVKKRRDPRNNGRWIWKAR